MGKVRQIFMGKALSEYVAVSSPQHGESTAFLSVFPLGWIIDHNLLQAICRTNRVYAEKTHGLIVDYLGVFDEVGTALDFDDQSIKKLSQIWKSLKKSCPNMSRSA